MDYDFETYKDIVTHNSKIQSNRELSIEEPIESYIDDVYDPTLISKISNFHLGITDKIDTLESDISFGIKFPVNDVKYQHYIQSLSIPKLNYVFKQSDLEDYDEIEIKDGELIFEGKKYPLYSFEPEGTQLDKLYVISKIDDDIITLTYYDGQNKEQNIKCLNPLLSETHTETNDLTKYDISGNFKHHIEILKRDNDLLLEKKAKILENIQIKYNKNKTYSYNEDLSYNLTYINGIKQNKLIFKEWLLNNFEVNNEKLNDIIQGSNITIYVANDEDKQYSEWQKLDDNITINHNNRYVKICFESQEKSDIELLYLENQINTSKHQLLDIYDFNYNVKEKLSKDKKNKIEHLKTTIYEIRHKLLGIKYKIIKLFFYCFRDKFINDDLDIPKDFLKIIEAENDQKENTFENRLKEFKVVLTDIFIFFKQNNFYIHANKQYNNKITEQINNIIYFIVLKLCEELILDDILKDDLGERRQKKYDMIYNIIYKERLKSSFLDFIPDETGEDIEINNMFLGKTNTELLELLYNPENNIGLYHSFKSLNSNYDDNIVTQTESTPTSYANKVVNEGVYGELKKALEDNKDIKFEPLDTSNNQLNFTINNGDTQTLLWPNAFSFKQSTLDICGNLFISDFEEFDFAKKGLEPKKTKTVNILDEHILDKEFLGYNNDNEKYGINILSTFLKQVDKNEGKEGIFKKIYEYLNYTKSNIGDILNDVVGVKHNDLYPNIQKDIDNAFIDEDIKISDTDYFVYTFNVDNIDNSQDLTIILQKLTEQYGMLESYYKEINNIYQQCKVMSDDNKFVKPEEKFKFFIDFIFENIDLDLKSKIENLLIKILQILNIQETYKKKTEKQLINENIRDIICDFFDLITINISSIIVTQLDEAIEKMDIKTVEKNLKRLKKNKLHEQGKKEILKKHLDTALKQNDNEIYKLILDNFTEIELIDKINDELEKALSYESYEVSIVLLDKGANINFQNDQGNTLLMEEAKKDDLNKIKFLLKNGSDVKIKNNNGETALNIAEDDKEYIETRYGKKASEYKDKIIIALKNSEIEKSKEVKILKKYKDDTQESEISEISNNITKQKERAQKNWHKFKL